MPTVPLQSQNNGIDWGGLINTGLSAMSDMYGNYVNAQMAAAGMANAASAAAQQNQFAYNMEALKQQISANTQMMRESMAYNAQSAEMANALQYKMQQEAMAFNSEEAKKQRDWSQQMSATAYQRAVEDMRKAGINPILAATNGGANVGSGASATISSAKAAQANSIGTPGVGLPSVGNYTGQGYHLSDTFAMFGAMLGTVGNILSAFQAKKSTLGNDVQNYVTKGTKQIVEGIEKGIEEIKNEYTNKNSNFRKTVNAFLPFNYGSDKWFSEMIRK